MPPIAEEQLDFKEPEDFNEPDDDDVIEIDEDPAIARERAR